MMQITRSQFRGAIKAGIATLDATDPKPLATALQNVGLVASRVTVGTFYSNALQCGCPLVVAGITNEDAEPTEFGFQHGFKGGFASEFDSAIRDLVPPAAFLNSRLVEIVG